MSSTQSPDQIVANLSAQTLALQSNITQFWTLINGIIVFCVLLILLFSFVMACGFLLVEAGSVGAKNVVNTCLRNLIDHNMLGVIFYWIFGYAFAFGSPGMFFSGYWYFTLSGAQPDTTYAHFVFQYALASVVPLIVSAGVAERVRFESYLVFSVLCSTFIYPICSHWQWSTDGWLYVGIDQDNPAGPIRLQDFAGSVAIHTLGGTMAFVAAILVGPRTCRVNPHGGWRLLPAPPPHNLLMCTAGTLILEFCFLCFNGGQQLSMSVSGDGAGASRAVVNSLLSLAGAALSAVVLAKLFPKHHWSSYSVNNACLAGLVTACAGCNVYDPWAAFVVGVISGCFYKFVTFILRILQVDDPCDTIAVHLGGGVWGAIGSAFFHRNIGIIFNWNRRSGLYLSWQLAGIGAAIVWGTFWSLLIFGVLRATRVLRANWKAEVRGVDWFEHGQRAYPPSAYWDGWPDPDGDNVSEACAPPAGANSPANLLNTGGAVVQFEGEDSRAGLGTIGGDDRFSNSEGAVTNPIYGVYKQSAGGPYNLA